MGSRSFWHWLAIAALALWAAPALADIPQDVPADTGAAMLFLKLDVNGTTDGPIVAVQQQGDRFLIARKDLRAVGLRLDGDDGTMVDPGTLPGVQSQYDEAQQSLNLIVPPSLLPMQRINAEVQQRTPAVSNTGFLLGYDLYTQKAGGVTTASLWTEQRAFGGFGVLSNTGVTRMGYEKDGYVRYDTRLTYIDEKRALVATAGDMISGALDWSNAVRMGGIQIARNFRVRPDLVLTPLPEFAGQASVPSAVDLFINGQRSNTQDVRPGPFVLDTAPAISGAGEAVVVTTDANGRRVATSIPFYVASTLLKPGLVDFSVEAGALRRGYGIRNFSYGMAVASGVGRFGVTKRLTIEGQAQLSRRVQVAGVGAVFAPGLIGTVNGSIAYSHTNTGRQGTQMAVGYDYTGRRFGFSVQHIERSANYRDLASFDLALVSGARRSDRAVATVSLDRAGSIGVGYIDARYASGSRSQFITASYTLPFGRNLNLFASADANLQTGDIGARFRLIVPFGRNSISGGVDRAANGKTRVQADFVRAIPSQGGLGVTASVARDGDGNVLGQGEAIWRTTQVQFNAGASHGVSGDAYWGGASGSVLFFGKEVMPAAQVNDSFALVSTDGMADVPVVYENQLVGRTNRRGRLLVPSVTSYHPGRYAIDPLPLAGGVSTPVVEKRVAIRAGSGAIITFPVLKSQARTLSLHDANGKALEVGGVVEMPGGKDPAVIGWDGIVYLEAADPGDTFGVVRADGSRCKIVVPQAGDAWNVSEPTPCL